MLVSSSIIGLADYRLKRTARVIIADVQIRTQLNCAVQIFVNVQREHTVATAY